MGSVKKEKCTACGNMTVGVFQPSDIRKLLTSTAKKGGMKAVLGLAGNMGFPVVGGIGGFLAGTAIDFFYGDDINKFIDKIADWFEDEKKYVFNCPNCGKVWTRKYDEILDNLDEVDDEEDYISELYNEIESHYNEAKQYDILSNQFREEASFGINLAKKCLDAISQMIDDEDYDEEAKDALIDIECDLRNLGSDFLAYIADQCKGSINSGICPTEEDRKASFAMNVNGAYPLFFSESIMLVGVILRGEVKLNQPIIIPDIESGSIITVERIAMFGNDLECAEAGDVCSIIIPNSYIDGKGEKHSLQFPDNCFTIKSPKDFASHHTSMLTDGYRDEEQEYINELKACLEEDGEITSSTRRLLTKLAKRLGITPQRADELEKGIISTNLTDEEEEYINEYKECLANDGKISASERRLLDKLRIRLGITSERAIELEKSIELWLLLK